ncbi:tectonic-1 isoform X2 [Corythoichthys intestinalis]|uniref:tectonic-1 isoform X2 n=1 Tax=Corythoichthys intestinalis TaxID=161448 RepID=UPI0025A5E69C|nr:tectonic-1 isoform X2 [Corythoichthys intestinalis]
MAAMSWFIRCCVYRLIFFQFDGVTSDENNSIVADIHTRNVIPDESLQNSVFALAKASESSMSIAENTNQQLFNIEPLPASGILPSYVNDVGSVCSCDKHRGFCDVNCCCDRECIQDVALFTGCSMTTISGNKQLCSHATASYALQFTVEGYSELQSFVQQDAHQHSFCIQSFSRVDGFYFPAPTLPLAGTFDSLFKQFKRFDFSSQENDRATDVPAVLHKYYQYGDPIISATVQGKRGIFSLPTSSVSFDCVDESPAAFLVDRTSLCSRRVDLKDDCSFLPALSIDTYTNIKLYAANTEGATIIPVMTASVMLQSLEGTLSKVRVSEAANLRPHFINQNVCTNVVLKVSYLVKYNTTGQIVNAEVELLLGNFHLTPLSLQQEYGIKFIQDSIDNIPVRKSGNPGYAVGLPILSGQAIAEGMLLNSNPGDRLSLLQSSANHNCMNSPHQRSPVLFGVESMSGCTLRLEDTTNCSLVSQIILDVLQGQTYPQYVAKFGNSALENSLEWLTIKHANNNKKTLAVPELLRAGLTPTEIAANLRISRCAVYKVKKKLKDTGTAS